MCATVGAETNKNKKQENKEPNKQHKMKNTNRKTNDWILNGAMKECDTQGFQQMKLLQK